MIYDLRQGRIAFKLTVTSLPEPFLVQVIYTNTSRICLTCKSQCLIWTNLSVYAGIETGGVRIALLLLWLLVQNGWFCGISGFKVMGSRPAVVDSDLLPRKCLKHLCDDFCLLPSQCSMNAFHRLSSVWMCCAKPNQEWARLQSLYWPRCSRLSHWMGRYVMGDGALLGSWLCGSCFDGSSL